VNESDAQNVFVFQSTGFMKVISERPSFLHLSIVQTTYMTSDDFFTVSGLAYPPFSVGSEE
jgi:uncharacterized membrane protein